MRSDLSLSRTPSFARWQVNTGRGDLLLSYIDLLIFGICTFSDGDYLAVKELFRIFPNITWAGAVITPEFSIYEKL